MKKLARIVTLALLLNLTLSAQVPLFGQTARSGKSASQTAGQYRDAIKLFEEFTRKHMALDKTVGLTIGFVKDDFVWVNAYGYADLENKVPAKAESAYRLASVTKPMTGIAIMQLVEKGKIDLDAEVQTYVSYFPKKKWPVTVRQVLGHLGGISHYKNAAQELHIKDHKSTRDAVAIFENFDLVAEPGTRYSYSSYGYNLLGAIIEAASGMSYGDYMRQNVWLPLGMNDTRMDDPLEVIPNRVRGYQLIDGKVKNSEFVDISSRFAAGGTRSTVPDLLKFAQGVMAGKLLSENSMNVATTSMSNKEGRLTNYAMGWETTPFNGYYMITHSGGQNETRTLLYIFPARRMALAVGVNFEASNPGVYVGRLFQLLTGAPLELAPYSPDKTRAAWVDAMQSAFNYGHAHFERTGKPLAASQDELVEAFAYFNRYVNPDALNPNQQETIQKIRQGAHPAAGYAFTKVGSYMASRLSEKNGRAKLDSYASLGALEFFNDYISLTNADPAFPRELRMNAGLEQATAAMARDWRKSNTEYVRKLWLMPDADFGQLRKNLQQSFSGSSVYPNLVDDFFSVTRQMILSGERARALETSQLAVDLYPAAATPNLMRGIALLVNQQPAPALESLKKAASINPQGATSAGGLNSIAYQLAGVGMLEEGMGVLRVAIEMHPKEANLYDSLGEFQLRKGDKAKALESYKRALEINPEFPNATNAREVVKKLTSEVSAESAKQ
jgi:CubicO group peptidase (beta-lactamase class C family)/tetratricopeptide (TPR) repeat protein